MGSRRKSLRRNSILRSVENMATITEENEKQIKSVNWNSYIDPRNEHQFEKKVVQYLLPNWEHEQDLFDDELLKSMFHWNPDDYCKLPNKTRRNRNRNRNSNSFVSRNNVEMDNNAIPESIKNSVHHQGLQNSLLIMKNLQFRIPIQILKI